jgi:threonine synthase
VSPRQAHQLTCWGDNVRSFEIDGSFDDCQKLVKAAFTDPVLNRRHRLSAANSINLGRLLPQTAYHAAAAIWHWREQGQPLNFIVPSGNLGNGLACVWARAMGLPIGRIVLAVNANKTIPDFLSTGEYRPRGSVATLASAMDVGAPSNMERLRHLIPDFADLRAVIDAVPVSDDQIRQAIELGYRRYEEVWCPHTATGFWVYDQLAPGLRREHAWVVLATAHPAKFETIVEPIIGRAVAMPAALAKMLEQPAKSMALAAQLSALAAELDRW